MNIPFEQVEQKSQVISYLLAAFAVFTVLMLTVSFVRESELPWPVSSTSGPAVQVENSDLPVPIPAPVPPIGQEPSGVRHVPDATRRSALMLQVIAVPMPSVP